MNLNVAENLGHAHNLVAPRAWAGFLLAASWLSAASFKDGVSTLVAVLTTAATGYVLIAQKIDANRRARRRADFDEALEERKATEDADRASLAKHLDEATADRDKMRATLHAINDEIHVRNLEYAALRQDFVKVTGQLVEANARLAAAALERRPGPGGETPH